MFKPVLLGGLLGGIAMFIWGAVSWTVLSWHDDSIERFTNESVVARDLNWYAPSSGVYILPNPNKFEDGLNTEEQQHAMDDAMDRMKSGPFVFVSINKGGADPEDPRQFAYAMFVNVIIAGLLTWMLVRLDLENYAQRYLFVICVGFVAATMAAFPHWNWWKFSDVFALTTFLDIWAAFAISGLVVAWAGKEE